MNMKMTVWGVITSVSLGLTGISTVVQAKTVLAANNSLVTQLCVTASAGNRAAMHNAIKSSGFSRRYIAENVTCNGKNIINFIDQYGRNAEAMINTLNRSATRVSIIDIAKNTIVESK